MSAPYNRLTKAVAHFKAAMEKFEELSHEVTKKIKAGEELAATSEELSSQAEQLQEMIGYFKIA